MQFTSQMIIHSKCFDSSLLSSSVMIPLTKTAVETFGVNNHLASELHLIFPMKPPSRSTIFALYVLQVNLKMEMITIVVIASGMCAHLHTNM